MQFAQHGPRAICVLSANGAISSVTLRQQSSSGGTVTYEVLTKIDLTTILLEVVSSVASKYELVNWDSHQAS